MPDREKVISEFEDFVKSFSKRDDTYYKGLFVSVLALLKEQEHKDKMFHALEDDWKRLKGLHKERDGKPMIENETGWNCPSCGMNLIGKTASGYPCDLIDLPEDEPIHFCPRCGQAVKWE